MVRSSLPFNSPLMTTDLPIFTMSLSMLWWLASERGPGTPAVIGGGCCGTAVGCPLGGRTASSRFHIVILRLSGFQGARVFASSECRDLKSRQYMEPVQGCLVLLLPRVRGSDTMNDSLCVS